MKFLSTILVFTAVVFAVPSHAKAGDMTMRKCRTTVMDIAQVYSVDKKCPFLTGDEYASLTTVKRLVHKLCQTKYPSTLNNLAEEKIWRKKCVSPETMGVYRNAHRIIEQWENK
jgi:hypothetical protein